MLTFGSCFAGIGGFDLGFERAGMRALWNVERDPKCRQLLAMKFPAAAQFDDVCTVGRKNLAAVDVICGGFPCQDLSTAGPRSGLAGARSGLFYQLTRITDELRPALLVFENVSGLLSSEDGRDVARVLMELDRIGYDGAWRVFDAQYFGVAQRRRRIFGVFARRDSGASRCAEVLSLAEGLRGHPAPRRKTGEGITGTLTRGSLDGSGACGGDGRDSFLVAGTLQASGKSAGSATQQDAESGLLIAHTLSASHDASEDGTGRGLPLVAACLQERDSKGSDSNTKPGHLIVCPFDSTQITSRTNRSQPQPGAPCHTLARGAHAPAIAFSCKDYGAEAGELAPTLRAMGHRESHANGGGQIGVVTPEVADPITANEGGTYSHEGSHNFRLHNVVAGVRRLTPRECERLQGFPDDWTLGYKDGVRYRMLGNAVPVPCAEWIGRRIVAKWKAVA